MKAVLAIIFLSIIAISCTHDKKASIKNYSPTVSFQLEGKLYEAKVRLPKNFKEKVPLVVIVHEWWGRTPYIQKRAEMITEKGYAALAIDLYGNGQTVTTPDEAKALATPFYENPETSVELLKSYIELAKRNPHIDENQIYVIGYCFGGTQALNLARSGADIQGVVSFHGGLATTYPTRSIQAKVLVLNGAADPMVPPKDVKALEAEMKKAGAQYKMVHYPGALHAFTNPKATEVGKKYNIPIAYNKKADKESWKELLKFLPKK